MAIHLLLVSLLPLVLDGTVRGHKTPSEGPTKALVRCADGSTIHVVILDSKLEVMTKYGKLTVPSADIKRIELSLRVSEETTRRIDSAIGCLMENVQPDRDDAVRELVSIGLPACPALLTVLKSKEPEVRTLAETVLGKIREKVPAEQLSLPSEDRIHTPGFVIAGRIVTPGLRVRTSYFGETTLNWADLRNVRSLEGTSEFELKIDAGKYGSQDKRWLETEIMVEAGTKLVITADGKVDLWNGSGGYVCGPEGYGHSPGQKNPLPGTLMARVGANGKPFIIGQRYEGTTTESGLLHLNILPSPWGNPSIGEYAVKGTVGE